MNERVAMATQGQQQQHHHQRQSVTRVQSSILRTNETNNYLYEEHHDHHHQLQWNIANNLNSTFARSSSRNNDDKQQKHLLRNHHQSTPQKQAEVSDLDSQATYATAYAINQNGHQQNGRPTRQQTRPSRPPRRSNGTTTAAGGIELNSESRSGDNPQRVRLSEHYTSGRSHSAAPVPRASHAPAVVTTRTGRFVDSYPASRQPARSSGRSTSPYAFHVPQPPPLAFNLRLNCSTTYATPTSRATSPSYAYAEYYYNNNNNSNDLVPQQQEQQLVTQRASGRGQYGYVARTEGDQIRQPAASKFNRSLRSRTIAHLPSMVQVTNGEGLEDEHEETEILHQKCGNVGATSEGDLLKAHTIAWRSSDLGRENPFKPGTELSLEADLMVRLIKRGYPMDELPQLVEAAKSEVAAKASLRSKSCDRLTHSNTNTNTNANQQQAVVAPSQGYLRANLRREAERQQPHTMSHSQSHHELGSKKKPEVVNREDMQTAAESRCDIERNSRAKSANQLEEAKAVWANSLKRAKSMPRFHATTCLTDADSLDQLITSIELEISDLLERTSNTTTTAITGGSYENKPQVVAAENKLISEKEKVAIGHEIELELTRKKSKTGSPLKAKVANRPKTSSSSSSPKREPAGSRRTSGETATVRRGQVSTTTGQDLKTGAPRPLRGQATPVESQAIKKKDKLRCCSIQ